MSAACNKLKNNIGKLREKIKFKPEIIWEDEHLKNWKVIAEGKQEFYCESLGDRIWEEYKSNELEFLKLKIGFAVFGPSAEVIDENVDEPRISFLDPEQKKTIERITELICKISDSDNIFTAFIFIIALVDNEYAEFPVIRILNKKSDCVFFVDMLGRVYKDWDDFMDRNIFPCCICCYPKNGFYFCNNIGKVELDFEYSPESSKLRHFLRKIDTVNSVAGIGSAAVGIAALAVPVSAPVVLSSAVAGLASGVWSTCRTVRTMVDRKKHLQTLSLSDQNARSCWLSLAAGILGGASAGAMQYTEFIARSGQVLSKVPCMAVNSLEIGNIGIGGLSIVNHVLTIIQKKEFTFSDSAQLILSVLFFFHASLSFKTAKAIVLDIQNDILSNVEKELNFEQQNAFRTILHETRKNGLIEGNAGVIKSLKNIKDKQFFIQELVGSTFKGDEITDPMEVKSHEVLQGENMRQNITILPKNEKLQMRTNIICKKFNIENLNDFCIEDKQLFSTASPDEVNILYKTIIIIETSQSNPNAFEKILKEIKTMGRSVSCHSIQDFILLVQNILLKYEECKQAYLAVKKLLAEFRFNLQKQKQRETLLKSDSCPSLNISEEDDVILLKEKSYIE